MQPSRTHVRPTGCRRVALPHLVLQNAGPDPDGFIDFYRDTLAERLRAIG